MPRRLAAALATAVVLVLQLALGLMDSACMARMSGSMARTAVQTGGTDMTACDDSAAQTRGGRSAPEHDRAPSDSGGAPVICHALAACGVSFLGAASCDIATTDRPVVVRVASAAATAPLSVTFPPELPPPRA